MGSFDRAEICEIFGLYLLNKLSNLLGKENVGLYRDDGLATIKSCSGPILDRTRKNIMALFKIYILLYIYIQNIYFIFEKLLQRQLVNYIENYLSPPPPHLTYWSTKNWWWQPHFLVFNKIQNTRQHHFETNKRSNFDYVLLFVAYRRPNWKITVD